MDKTVVDIHNGFYSAIKKSKFGSVLMRCMKLEPIIQSGNYIGKNINTVY